MQLPMKEGKNVHAQTWETHDKKCSIKITIYVLKQNYIQF
jgi:hypothetical protein